jgi:hypothetical protein
MANYTGRLNFSLSRIAYADCGAIGNNPTLRSFDFTTQENGLLVKDASVIGSTIQPGQSITLKSNERPLTSDATSTFQVDIPLIGNDIVRYRYAGVGTAPAFRVSRAIGTGATTQLNIALSGNSAAVITCTSGTVPLFDNIQVGDNLFLQASDNSFTSPFNINNTSLYPGILYTVIDKSSTSVTIRNPGNIIPETVALGANFADVLRVFSGSGVQLGDSVMFDSTCNLNVQNKSGQFNVCMVTDRDVYLLNTAAVVSAPVALGGIMGDPVRVFSDIISFIVVDADGEVTLRLNNNPLGDIQLFCYLPNKAIFAGSINATSVTAINNTTSPITVRINTASF